MGAQRRHGRMEQEAGSLMRRCPSCGKEEQRELVKGWWSVNLDPTTGLCVDCLVKSKPAKPMPSEPFDSKRAAAGRDE